MCWIEGNHEHRIKKYANRSPELRDLVSIDHNFQDMWDRIEWFPTWAGAEIGQLPLRIGKNTLVLHGQRHNKYHASAMAADFSPWTVLYGHTHALEIGTKETFKAPGETWSSQAFSVGHLAHPQQGYSGHKPGRWMHGFVELGIDAHGLGHVAMHPIVNGRCFFRGRVFDGSKAVPKTKVRSPIVHKLGWSSTASFWRK
ncbi:MAG: hypothetical protein HC927_00200 [Deltaproteobacteria bacterium]|nr:hypothetical protein [Deltaproteobacteria bacterium]